VEKFRKLTRGVISPQQQADISELVLHMEDQADMRRLTEVLGAR
jgi:peptidyl-tRNA hydrolase